MEGSKVIYPLEVGKKSNALLSPSNAYFKWNIPVWKGKVDQTLDIHSVYPEP